jgi:hypothetical protein
MAVAVSLQFTLPAEVDIAELIIWEGSSEDGPFTQIDSTTSVGTYPNYITHYTTTEATAVDDWFAISWIDSNGATSELSEPWQGGVDSIVNQVADRVTQRDTSLAVPVVIQETEAAVESYFGINPYDVTEEDLGDRKYRILSGLTYLVMARSMLVRIVRSNVLSDISSVSLGLVTMRTGGQSSSAESTSLSQIQALIDMANKELGISTSFVAQLTEIENIYGQHTTFALPWVIQ